MNEWLNSDLETLTDRVLASYDSDRQPQRIGETFLSSREPIVEIVHEIWQLLFPGFYGHEKLTRQNIKFHMGALLS